MHIKRAHLQTLLWKAGECDQPPVVNISMYTWEPGTDGMPQTPNIGTTDVAPKMLLKAIACTCAYFLYDLEPPEAAISWDFLHILLQMWSNRRSVP